MPPCILDPVACGFAFDPPELFQQYREGAHYNGKRFVLHDFESMTVDPSYVGPVHDSPIGAAVAVDMLVSNPPYSGHVSTRAVSIEVGPDRHSSLRFEIPRDVVDLSEYAFLSLRLGEPALKQLGLAQANCVPADPGDISIDVTLKDAWGAEHTVSSVDWVRITDPDFFWSPILNDCVADEYLTTLRIPLLEFWQGDVKGEGVIEIELTFDLAKDDGYAHAVLVDSVEVTYSDLDPYCGNDFIETTEECDGIVAKTCSEYDPIYIGGDLACTDACLLDTSGCIEQVCGNGVVEGTEECDDGNLDPYDDCNTDCTICPAGDPLCRCLGLVPGEEHPDLFEGGLTGNEGYCTDDVLFGGLDRCVEMYNGNFACISCEYNSGPGCPCVIGDSCSADYPPGVGPDVSNPDVPIGANMSCNYALKDPEAPGGLDPALTDGYCFSDEPTVEEGAMPEWFLQWYCEQWHPDTQFEFDEGLGNLCLLY